MLNMLALVVSLEQLLPVLVTTIIFVLSSVRNLTYPYLIYGISG